MAKVVIDLTPMGNNIRVVDQLFATTGAMLTGRRTYEIAGA
ncbi:MAG TPA: hypothetical protein VF998_06290 [Candidatus Limnocylindria bacterium]